MSNGGTILVSASDATYFPLLSDLLTTVELHRPAGPTPDVGILNLGLTPTQLDQIRPRVKHLVAGQWNFDFPTRATLPRWVQGLTARPYLRDYFPGYSRYIWIDADIWLQDWRAIELLSAGQANELVVIPEIHCAYPYLYGIGTLPENNRIYATESFGPDGAKLLSGRAVINAGMFSIGDAASFWEVYRNLVIQGFTRGPNKWTEQYAMNLAIYAGQVQMRPLPAWCNWICIYSAPSFDADQKCFCESTWPNQKLSALHLTGEHGSPKKLWTTKNEPIELPLDYSGFKRALDAM